MQGVEKFAVLLNRLMIATNILFYIILLLIIILFETLPDDRTIDTVQCGITYTSSVDIQETGK